MRIAVVSEVSARDKNPAILAALEPSGATVHNVGMTADGDEAELTYLHTGLMAALALDAGAVDLVVGGCGTGAGFLMSAMQYPGVFGGLLTSPLDAWLFSQINGGNCVSLPLNQGYGWAGDVQLGFVFEKLFRDRPGAGYPPHRRESQQQSRATLAGISGVTHRPMAEILRDLDDAVRGPVLAHRPFAELLERSGTPLPTPPEQE